jgi:hypothetical protein
MGTYSITRHKDGASFDVSVLSDNGAQQTLLGFKTLKDAEAWVADDRRRSSAGDTKPSEFGMPAGRSSVLE